MNIPPKRNQTGLSGVRDLAQKGQVITFSGATHNPTAVSFNAFLQDFQDSFQSKWNEEPVYGRMDPISVFQGTVRKITLAWAVVASDIEEARINFFKISDILKMLYPGYSSPQSGRANTMSSSPLMRIKFCNLIQRPDGVGLLGYVDGFNHKPDNKMGYFHDSDYTKLYPKIVEMSCTFSVLHEHSLGFHGKDPLDAFDAWPYSRTTGELGKLEYDRKYKNVEEELTTVNLPAEAEFAEEEETDADREASTDASVEDKVSKGRGRWTGGGRGKAKADSSDPASSATTAAATNPDHPGWAAERALEDSNYSQEYGPGSGDSPVERLERAAAYSRGEEYESSAELGAKRERREAAENRQREEAYDAQVRASQGGGEGPLR